MIKGKYPLLNGDFVVVVYTGGTTVYDDLGDVIFSVNRELTKIDAQSHIFAYLDGLRAGKALGAQSLRDDLKALLKL